MFHIDTEAYLERYQQLTIRSTTMALSLKEKLAGIIPKLREERKAILKEHGEKKISDVTVAQAFGGMRGVKGMICDT